MKKVIYAILAGIVIIGAIIICTIGLNVDMIYKRNVELNVYIGKTVEINDIKQIVEEVFPGEKSMVQMVDAYNDTVAITLPERTNDELRDKIIELNTKLNEKYEVENEAEAIEIYHNPKVKLSSLLQPYVMPILITVVIVIVYAMIRYRKLNFWKTGLTYLISIIGTEAVYLGILAIVRFPINRLVIPLGLIIYVATVCILGWKYEKKLEEISGKKKK